MASGYPTCPKCRRVMYFTCTNKECSCWKRVPKGKKPLEWVKPDAQKCPYCGYTALCDYWEIREIEQTFPNGFPKTDAAWAERRKKLPRKSK